MGRPAKLEVPGYSTGRLVDSSTKSEGNLRTSGKSIKYSRVESGIDIRDDLVDDERGKAHLFKLPAN